MSRIGKLPVVIPAGVDVTIDGQNVTVKNSKTTLTHTIPAPIVAEVKDNTVVVTRPNDERENRSLHGLTRTLIANMIEGLVNGYKKELQVNGVGYRAALQGKDLVLNLGYSNQVIVKIIDGITVEVPNPNTIVVSGADKQQVGQFAAEIRKKRPPEPYKGKGIKYADEHIRRKEGKAGKK